MAVDMNIIKVSNDAVRGHVEKYSVGQANDLIREALVEANNGSTKIDYKAIRDGKCPGLFSLIEELISSNVMEGLMENDFFMNEVEFHDYALGDAPVFKIEDEDLFVVDEIAPGTQGIRRQRLAGLREVMIPTKLYGVRIYEELDRILAKRVDFTDMIAKVGKSFQQKMMTDIYGVFAGIDQNDLGGSAYYNAGGQYSEATLLNIIEHVEAASGTTATIIGTKKAVRHLQMSVLAEKAKEDLYNTGIYGSFYGSPVLVVPQRHTIGTTTFAYPDNVLTILATNEKPVKVVREGEPLMINRDPELNVDLTQEYFYSERWGAGVLLPRNSGFGHYEFTN